MLALAGQLEAYKKTKTHIEKHETEEGEDEADEEESSPPSPAEDEAEESEEEEAAGDETDRTEDDPDDQGDDPDDDEDSDEDEDEDEEEASASEEEEAKAAASAIVRASGLTTNSARAALRKAATAMITKTVRGSAAYKVFRAASKITKKKSASAIVASLEGNKAAATELKTRVAAIEADRRAERKASMIENAVTKGRITPVEAKTLAGKKLSFVESYLDMRPNALVNRKAADGGETRQPSTGSHRGPAAAPNPTDPAVQRELRRGVAAARTMGLKLTEADLIKGMTDAPAVKFPEN